MFVEEYTGLEYRNKLIEGYSTINAVKIIDKLLVCPNYELTSLGTPKLWVEKIFCDYNKLTTLPFLPIIRKIACDSYLLEPYKLEIGKYFSRDEIEAQYVPTSLAQDTYITKDFAIQCLLVYKLSRI
jgi:hypothetical protein